jgi:hypothetical protein
MGGVVRQANSRHGRGSARHLLAHIPPRTRPPSCVRTMLYNTAAVQRLRTHTLQRRTEEEEEDEEEDEEKEEEEEEEEEEEKGQEEE